MRKTILVAILLVVFSCLFENFAFAASTANVKTHIVKNALEIGVDPALALSIAKTESGFCHNKKSRHGAVGVFQLMPSTARRLGYNPYYLNENIKGGLTYYKMMYNKFGSVELALAAYNAGPGIVAKYNGMPPYKETKRFVSTIMTEYNKQKANPDPVIYNVKNKNAQKAQAKPKAEPAKQPVKPEETNKTPAPVGENVLSMFVGMESSSTK